MKLKMNLIQRKRKLLCLNLSIISKCCATCLPQTLIPSQINVYPYAKYKCNICVEVSTKLGYQ